MRDEIAFKVVRNLRRYRTFPRKPSAWDHTGPYVPQNLIPRCTAGQEREAHRLMAKGNMNVLGAIRWVRVARLRSTQNSLRFKSLLWNVANFETMQKTFGRRTTDMDVRGVNLPIVVWVYGVPVIWNGNHRTTAAILLDRELILVRAFKKRR